MVCREGERASLHHQVVILVCCCWNFDKDPESYRTFWFCTDSNFVCFIHLLKICCWFPVWKWAHILKQIALSHMICNAGLLEVWMSFKMTCIAWTNSPSPQTKNQHHRVSSVLNRDTKQFGKHHMFDGSSETCWNSHQVGLFEDSFYYFSLSYLFANTSFLCSQGFSSVGAADLSRESWCVRSANNVSRRFCWPGRHSEEEIVVFRLTFSCSCPSRIANSWQIMKKVPKSLTLLLRFILRTLTHNRFWSSYIHTITQPHTHTTTYNTHTITHPYAHNPILVTDLMNILAV